MKDKNCKTFLSGGQDRNGIASLLVFSITDENQDLSIAALSACRSLIVGPKTAKLFLDQRLLGALLCVLKKKPSEEQYPVNVVVAEQVFGLCTKIFNNNPSRPVHIPAASDAINILHLVPEMILCDGILSQSNIETLTSIWASGIRFVSNFVRSSNWNSLGSPNNISCVLNEAVNSKLRRIIDKPDKDLNDFLRMIASVCLLVAGKPDENMNLLKEGCAYIFNNFKNVVRKYPIPQTVPSISTIFEVMLEQMEQFGDTRVVDKVFMTTMLNFILDSESPIKVDVTTADVIHENQDIIKSISFAHYIKGCAASLLMGYIFDDRDRLSLENLFKCIHITSMYAKESVNYKILNSLTVESLLSAAASIVSPDDENDDGITLTGLKDINGMPITFDNGYKGILDNIAKGKNINIEQMIPLNSLLDLTNSFVASTALGENIKHVFSSETVTSGLEVVRQFVRPLLTSFPTNETINAIMDNLSILLTNCMTISDSTPELVLEATDITLDLFDIGDNINKLAKTSCLRELRKVERNISSLLYSLCSTQYSPKEMEEQKKKIALPLERFLEKLSKIAPMVEDEIMDGGGDDMTEDEVDGDNDI